MNPSRKRRLMLNNSLRPANSRDFLISPKPLLAEIVVVVMVVVMVVYNHDHLRLRRIRHCEAEDENQSEQILFHALLSRAANFFTELL
jgi:hypothetical protein